MKQKIKKEFGNLLKNFTNELGNHISKAGEKYFNEENIKQKIFFEGQIYDAYSLIIDIIKKQIRRF